MDKKELIREAAIKVMSKEGFYSTKMQIIANEAGVAIGTIYLYFKNKEDILDYIFMIEYKKRLNFLDHLKESNMSYVKKIESFLFFHVNELKGSPDIAKILIQESVCPLLHKLEWINKTFNGIPDAFKWMLENAKLNGEVRDIDTDIIGTSIFLSSRALAYKLQVEGRENEYDYAMDQFVSFIFNGIKK
ncbi:MAG: hypothetical protein APF77_05190 [Clostridia bacterium BRH_c25]|nr:MAG: hypothetical protein APF77_05190 [Clostridia bacterium BRH_c25]